MNPRFLTLVTLIFAAAALRLIPHPANVAPIAALANGKVVRRPPVPVAGVRPRKWDPQGLGSRISTMRRV